MDNNLKIFACPTGPSCGARNTIAHKISKIYTIDSNVIDQLERFCNHEIRFSIEAGMNDILKIDFLAAPPGTKVYFSVGTSFESAEGQELTDNLIEKYTYQTIFLHTEIKTEKNLT